MAHYELRQQPDAKCGLRFVPDVRGPETAALNLLTARLAELLQLPEKISAEPVPMLVPTHSGKFRLTVPSAG
jgi:hypothetical protein